MNNSLLTHVISTHTECSYIMTAQYKGYYRLDSFPILFREIWHLGTLILEFSNEEGYIDSDLFYPLILNKLKIYRHVGDKRPH